MFFFFFTLCKVICTFESRAEKWVIQGSNSKQSNCQNHKLDDKILGLNLNFYEFYLPKLLKSWIWVTLSNFNFNQFSYTQIKSLWSFYFQNCQKCCFFVKGLFISGNPVKKVASSWNRSAPRLFSSLLIQI